MLCFYHSIMDWHHPDYLPRRGWEEAERPAEGAEFERYLEYLHAQVTELLTKYGPIGVMWFDGEWESTWSHERGQALYDLCRRLQPDVIVNNRVDVGRSGMAGLTEGPGYAGDFGTPEQEVPATGLPGVDWESCITMNNHWGWNEADLGWKSTSELVRLLVDVVSKGGNLLLNVGPRADGSFPPQAVERLQGIARWMRLHGEAIHGTQASPFAELPWGRCTKKRDGADTRLFLHVFDWPADGKLVIQGLGNDSFHACLLADGSALAAERAGTDLWIWLPEQPTDPDCPVIELRVNGEPIVYLPPRIEAAFDEFATYVDVEIKSASPALEVRFRRDGGEPGITDPVVDYPLRLRASVVITARAFHRGLPVSATVRREFRRVELLPAGDVRRTPACCGVCTAALGTCCRIGRPQCLWENPWQPRSASVKTPSRRESDSCSKASWTFPKTGCGSSLSPATMARNSALPDGWWWTTTDCTARRLEKRRSPSQQAGTPSICGGSTAPVEPCWN